MFEEQTPENLIKDIVPDILVKGGDYNIEDIVGLPDSNAKWRSSKNPKFL